MKILVSLINTFVPDWPRRISRRPLPAHAARALAVRRPTPPSRPTSGFRKTRILQTVATPLSHGRNGSGAQAGAVCVCEAGAVGVARRPRASSAGAQREGERVGGADALRRFCERAGDAALSRGALAPRAQLPDRGASDVGRRGVVERLCLAVSIRPGAAPPRRGRQARRLEGRGGCRGCACQSSCAVSRLAEHCRGLVVVRCSPVCACVCVSGRGGKG